MEADSPSPVGDAGLPDDNTLLRRAAEAGRDRRIAVVGDAILDRYRTPDGHTQSFAGGAAVIAGHLKQLGAEPVLITQLSADAHAGRLLRIVDHLGVEVEAIPTAAAQPTRLREVYADRITARPRQELVTPPGPETLSRLAGAVAERRLQLDAVVFADFGYGTVTAELLDALLPVIRPHIGVLAGDVSGARPSLLAMRRFDLLTPTEAELRRLSPSVSPKTPLDGLAQQLKQALALKHLLITRNAAGCVHYGPIGRPRVIPSRAAAVVDDVGAGDALLAAATLSLSSGLNIENAVQFGQIAAAAAIARVGNAPVTWDRLRGVFETTETTQKSARPAAPVPAAR
ncbi:MAG: PfkB family carbohydrate kinase [Planctomycetota bacterium]